METLVLFILVFSGAVLYILIYRKVNQLQLLVSKLSAETIPGQPTQNPNTITKIEYGENEKTDVTSADDSYSQWLRLVEKAENRSDRINILRSAFQRFTSEIEVYESYIAELRNMCDSTHDKPHRISLMEEMLKTMDIFLEFCDIDVWFKTTEEANKLSSQIAQTMQKVYDDKVNSEKHKIRDYSLQIERMIRERDFSEGELEKVKQFESELDHRIIKNEEDLFNKHKDLVMRLTEAMESDIQKPVVEKSYNLEALNKAEEVYKYFVKHEDIFSKANVFRKEKLDMSRLTSLNQLDFNRLTNETAQYVMYVNSYIFGKLDADQKLEFSKASLNGW